MIEHSALYEGWVRHRRLSDVGHAFRYPYRLMYLDIDEIREVFDLAWFCGYERPAPLGWRRKAYLEPVDMSLRAAVDHHLRQHTGKQSRGPIRILTSPGMMGLYFNPVSFYYCFDPSGTDVEFVLAEINNTPWDERHTYVIDVSRAHRPRPHIIQTNFRKDFHVSPFQPMEQTYTWCFTTPGQDLRIHMKNTNDTQRAFDATLVMQRTRINRQGLSDFVCQSWPTPWRTLTAIYAQAFRLWRNGATFHTHPAKRV